jgi:hypothetical protein
MIGSYRRTTVSFVSRRAGRVLAGACVVVALSGCSGDDPGAVTASTRAPGSPLSADDTARLSQLLFRNFTDGGAEVAVSFDYSADLSVRMVGVVDWRGHTGRLVVTSSFAGDRTPDRQDVVFEEDAVYESATPEDVTRLAAAGQPGVEWLRRSPDRAGRPVDQIIGLLVSLAATRPDNPQLLAQGETTYDRREEVGGEAADVYVTKSGASYWVSVDDDRLVRFKGLLEGFTAPVLIDLSSPGEQAVEIPTGPTVATDPTA